MKQPFPSSKVAPMPSIDSSKNRRRFTSRVSVIGLGAALLASLIVTPTTAAGATEEELEFRSIPTLESSEPGLSPIDLTITSVGDEAFFLASLDTTGTELWITDGNNTRLVSDIRPGPTSSNPISLLRFGNQVLFTADDGTNGRELWISDGSPEGTRLVADFNSGPGGTQVSMLGEVPTGYMLAIDSTELWITDGTTVGTTKVMDLAIAGGGRSLGDRVIFSGSTTNDYEPWVSDGTIGGTNRIADLNPGAPSSAPDGFTRVGGAVMFAAGDETAGREPWISDGTTAGTRRVADLWTVGGLGGLAAQGNGSSSPSRFVAAGDLVFFSAFGNGSARSQLYRTDGTEAGTVIVTGPDSIIDAPVRSTAFGDRLVFAGESSDGLEPWITSEDGTTSSQIIDLAPGSDSSLDRSGLPIGLSYVPFGDLMLFPANDGTNGVQMWATDGTSEGTFRISDLNPPAGISTVAGSTTINNGQGPMALFAADGGEGDTNVWLVQGPRDALTPVILGARYADDQIVRLYQASLGRLPDDDGLTFWVERYQSGEELESLAANFADSTEFTERFGEESTDEGLIDLLYRNVLNRPGDSGGVAFWLDQLANGTSRATVITAFAESPENIERTGTSTPITSTESKILRLYRAALGRIPDSGGLAFWVSTYESGQSLSQIASGFRNSPEFIDLYGSDVDDREFVDLLYRNVLGRVGDPGGSNFWIGQLSAGASRDDVLAQFAESPENLVRTNTRP